MSLLHELVSTAAAGTPQREAVVTDDGTSATFAEFDRQIRGVAGWVAARTAPGDRVAVVADNSAAYAQLYYAVPRSGRVLTLINQRLSPSEQAAQLATAGPTLLVGDDRYLSALAGTAAPVEHAVAFESTQWRAAPTADLPFVDDAQPDDPAWLLFTSGSTGVPKAVVHTHRSILTAVWGSVAGRSVQPGGVYLLPFPMCHIAGYNMLVQHAVAATVVLCAQFRPEGFAQLVRTHGVTSCSLAPTMLHSLLGHLEHSGTDLPTLNAIAYGSAAMPLDLLRRAIDALGVDFHQGYGMTETGGNITFLGPDDHRAGAGRQPELLTSAGHPHRAVEIGIIGASGDLLPTGQVGEIVVRGAQVTPGYWPDGAGTEGGWLHTGDMGRTDADGRLFVVDRLKDIIVTGGENVSSREVEDALSAHPGVDQVAVVAVPDDYWGEAVCAVVVPVQGYQPTADELIGHVRGAIAGFKRPRVVLFTEALPMTGNGKVAKDRVRAFARAAVLGGAENT
ncbi:MULTISPECIES: AMP-binding protein [unclassified Mycolicibacterium]|uniref:AMP-binding protein n=1 Tax=unclassified Mycolicibacterium TaxID=2636767 RepID=UPI0012DEBC5D|nr:MULTISPECIES: AMP-binding protein [unclassified Mycolicibacterium]MUL85408.1 long-chain fatty acid--CoA ligase [Mycolicibacterium sp. CBMA 329]MUL88828.1 long-chain fatty acid--CoA ligase [Mycolicibacterium sp. CBMA 331]MUM01898.1 long-chain fatty acid--CoA ligase [Mycolicibacterium sp. CBMA 334]MUM24918.1 long-chain fatty acid--CoA ligase [Mycolicibacterium sp. CBMA 295]MUM40475.1 long-chain fatty acid--CoA ligase [Mycolicibacterium sp. CBMA 247]